MRKNNHRDTENTEVAQRKKSENYFRAKPHQPINYNYSYAELSRTLKRFYDHLKPGARQQVTQEEIIRHRRHRLRLRLRKRTKESRQTQNKIFLPDRKRILEIMKQIGFTPKLYFDFSGTKRSGTVFVFIERKER